jgi:hypothetical protein
MGTRAEGFTYRQSDDRVLVYHHGRLATTLRGRRAVDFLEDVVTGDEQLLMARLTGNYKLGNERQARNHPRNR